MTAAVLVKLYHPVHTVFTIQDTSSLFSFQWSFLEFLGLGLSYGVVKSLKIHIGLKIKSGLKINSGLKTNSG